MNLCTSFHSRSMFHIENTAIWTSEFSQDVTQNRNAASLKKSLSYWRICLCAGMLVLEWKERAFKEKVNSRCFCWFPTAILLHQNGSPLWRLHTKLYKGAWNGSANNSETVGNKDLRLGKIIYILVFSNISFSRLLPLDGFQLIFLLRDSENDLMTGASTVTIPEVFANLNLAQFPGLLFSKVADLPSRHPCKED